MAQKSLFFSLPIELRLLVYNEVLMANDVQILRACRDIYNEALPVLFKQPLKFRTHEDLYNWIHMVGPDNLELVTAVSLNLLSFRYTSGTTPGFPPTTEIFYRNDFPTLQNALRLLPNLRCFTVYKSIPFVGTHSTLDYYLSFFPWLAELYPELRYLTWFINWIPVDFLLQMRFLRSLRFTGYSTTPQTASLAIFQSLKYLEELEVFGPPPNSLTFITGYKNFAIDSKQIVTPKLLLGIRPLKAFTICEIRTLFGTSGVFACEEMISALAQTHGSSLRSLKISLDFRPSADSRAALAKLFGLANSSIRHVELGWPGLDVLTLDTLPSSLRSLHVSCDAYFPPEDVARKLVTQKGVLPKLADVVLRRDWRTQRTQRTRQDSWLDQTVADPLKRCRKSNMSAAVARLKSAGLYARSGFWHPVMFDDLGGDYDDDLPRSSVPQKGGSGMGRELQNVKSVQAVNSPLPRPARKRRQQAPQSLIQARGHTSGDVKSP